MRLTDTELHNLEHQCDVARDHFLNQLTERQLKAWHLKGHVPKGLKHHRAYTRWQFIKSDLEVFERRSKIKLVWSA